MAKYNKTIVGKIADLIREGIATPLRKYVKKLISQRILITDG